MRTVLSIAVVAGLLGACADEGGPSFAPDAATETAVSALTPSPTLTAQAIDRQPGERDDTERTLTELAAGRGGAGTITTREDETLLTYDPTSGEPRQTWLTTSSEVVAVAGSSDGSVIVVLRRQGERLSIERMAASGESLSLLDLAPAQGAAGSPRAGTPEAGFPEVGTPVAGTPTAASAPVTRDRAEISPDGRHVVVISRDGDLSIVATDPGLTLVRVVQDFGDVSALGWTGDGTLALVATYDQSRATGNLTGVPLEGRLRSILRLPADDRRRVVQVASPAGSTDVFYAVRSAVDDWTAQNNLYRIPLVGGVPVVVLATGLVGPAGAVDRFAVTDDGRTVAASLLIPSDGELAFHSLWVTDVESTRPLKVETGGLGLVSRMAWTEAGLFVIGAQRERDDTSSRIATLSLLLDADGVLREVNRSESPATPRASPVASPEVATPVASPAA